SFGLSGATPGERMTSDRTPRDLCCARAGPVALHETGWDTPPTFMSTKTKIARNLAAAFLAGAWSLDGLVRRGALACGRRERWLRPLARRELAAVARPPGRPAWEALTASPHPPPTLT